MPKHRLCLARVALLTVAVALGSARATWGESGIVLPYPSEFGSYKAHTYDEAGRRIADAELVIEQRARGIVYMYVRGGAMDGARNEAHAELGPIEGKPGLRLLREQSHSHDPDGYSFGILRVDHVRGEASCTPPGDPTGPPKVVPLPDDDRVVNVPLNLFFAPLARGEVETLSFQIFLCRGGPRRVDFDARRSPELRLLDDRAVIEVTYGPRLNRMLRWLARGFTPNLAFWFDAADGSTYLAHRLPLYSKGPEVVIAREGVSVQSLSVSSGP